MACRSGADIENELHYSAIDDSKAGPKRQRCER